MKGWNGWRHSGNQGGRNVGWTRSAVGTQAPVDDLGFVDCESSRVRRYEARRLADGAIDVGDDSAGSADGVMVIVAHSRLVPGCGACRLDASHQAGDRQGMKYVVDRLLRDVGQSGAHGAENRFRIRVRVLVDCGEHGGTGAGHSKTGPT